MNPLRRPDDLSMGASFSVELTSEAVARRFPPEAYDYDGDISLDDLNRLKERAKPFLDGEWEIIDGYVGSK